MEVSEALMMTIGAVVFNSIVTVAVIKADMIWCKKLIDTAHSRIDDLTAKLMKLECTVDKR